ncbi:tight adherence pilus pseudopilin TadF [Vibrio tasmaniensis]|uniref:tight adherence pilus pseudopilin TadF n=1 Tax=Vibrio tasmaniensis TaxID=212663 RepID=UPI00107F2355|nr:tight adherence pilus pseudopilin TadF [Vibrio tasmaniensis]
MKGQNLKFRTLKHGNLKSKQQGVFSIEFAMVAVFFSLLIAFSGDVIIKLSLKGKLDRLSYSLVNVLKERTQLYDTDYQLTTKEVDDIDIIAQHSLLRTFGHLEREHYGLLVEELSFKQVGTPNPAISEKRGVVACRIKQTIDSLESMTVVTNRGREMPLYRVTVCYESDNWIGGILGREFTHVMSDSVVIGR